MRSTNDLSEKAANLLSPERVAEQLDMPKGQVRRLKIPRVRTGEGRGTLHYRQEDVDRYIQERLEYPENSEGGTEYGTIRPVSKRQKAVGFRGLPSIETLLKIPVGHKKRG